MGVDSEPSPHTSHHSPHHGLLIVSIMFAFFAVLMVLCLCCIRHLARRNQHNSRVNGTAAELPTAAAPSSCSRNDKLKPEVLASLQAFVYSSTPHVERLECTICLSSFREGEEGRVLPRCGHSFHADCIDVWFNSHFTCPLCRVNADESKPPDSAV